MRVLRPRVLLVNLPHRLRVQRRWVASYWAPNFLVPPLELMGLAALLRERRAADVALMDAVAEGATVDDVLARFRTWGPQWVVALPGFGSLEEDLAALRRIRDGLGRGARSAVFGHLPTQRPELLLAHAGVDAVLRGEPEDTLLDLLRAGPDVDPATIPGLAVLRDGVLVQGPPRARLKDLDALPAPDHSLVPLRHYGESFRPRPMGALLTARGCPYDCAFCVRAYGREVAFRSAEALLDDVAGLQRLGVRALRFMDDTFTLDRKRTLALSEELARRGTRLTWTCLTRADRLDEELAGAMARGGCRRVYVGVESANPERLRAWGKGLAPEDVERGVAAARASGIETCGFFIVGAPGEDEAERRRSLDFAVRLGLDWIIVTQLQRWPGTKLAPDQGFGGTVREEAPDPRDPFLAERRFYRGFYLRPGWLAAHAGLALQAPRDVAAGARELLRYAAGLVRGRDFI